MAQQRHQNELIAEFRQAAFKGESIPLTQSPEVELGIILGAGQHLLEDGESKRFDLCAVDLDDPNAPLTLIPMTFFGHGIVPHPNKPEILTVFEKRGKGACEIDLKQGAVTRDISISDNRQFYGHGAYSPDGKTLYCTETITEGDYEGLLTIRDANTHEYLGEMPSYGSSPHDCHLIDEGSTMVITNGGGPQCGVTPSVTYVDVKSEKLLEKLDIEADHINAGHLDITSAGKLAVVSAQREGLPPKSLGGISLKLNGSDTLHTLSEPDKLIERLYGESLSVCINESNGIVGATTPEGNLLTFWDIDTGKLIYYYIIRNPRGIELSLNGKYFIVSFGHGDPAEAICLIDANTLQHIRGFDISHAGITGSHLTAFSLPENLRQNDL